MILAEATPPDRYRQGGLPPGYRLFTISRPDPTPRSNWPFRRLDPNCREFGIRLHALGSERQGIVHVIGPELGLTQPGMTIVCGDSHTSTHGAFGALAFGIGTTEVAHVLMTQCLLQTRPKTLQVRVEGRLHPGVTAKDLILGIIAKIGVGGGTGHVIEYAGPAIRALSMEERMTVCNMSMERALGYMGLRPGQRLLGHSIDVVFIGSCTNARLSDLRLAASLLRGRKVAANVRLLVVPGSQQVKRQAEAEGLDRVFREAGGEWREAGCSMCIAMNGDQLRPGQYAVSTSNRNFEGRQGAGGGALFAEPPFPAAPGRPRANRHPPPEGPGGGMGPPTP